MKSLAGLTHSGSGNSAAARARRRLAGGLAAIAGLVWLSGCEQPAQQPAAPASQPAASRAAPPRAQDDPAVQTLIGRAQALWNARVKDDAATIFEYRPPASRADVDPNEFIAWHKQSEPFVYRAFRIDGGEVQGDMGWVKLNVTAAMRRFADDPGNTVDRWEKWRLVDGVWYPAPPEQQSALPEAPSLRDAAAEAIVRERVMACFEQRRAGDLKGVYTFVDPRDREKVTEEVFLQQGQPNVFVAAKIQWAEAVGERARVSLTYTLRPNDPSMSKAAPVDMQRMERWARVENQWYLDLIETEAVEVRFTPQFTLAREGLPAEGNYKCDPVVADVNNDRRADLLFHPRLGDGPQVFLGDGAGGWRESSDGLKMASKSCGGGLDVGDLNGDKRLDIVVADHCSGVHVYLGDGTGKWEHVIKDMLPEQIKAKAPVPEDVQGAEDVVLMDANGDGHLDIVAASSDASGVVLYLNDGSGRKFAETATALPTTGWTNRVQVADLNGDSKLDVVAGGFHAGPRVWLADEDHTKWKAASRGLPTPSVRGLFNGTGVGDVNGDGRPDLIIANWIDGPELYLQKEDQSWEKQPDLYPALRGGAYGIALGDLNGDGALDLVFSGRMTQDVGYVYGVFAMLGDGTGKFKPLENVGLPATGLPFTWGVELADLNGDSVLDVIAGSGGSVATNPASSQPTLNAGVLVWTTSLMPEY